MKITQACIEQIAERATLWLSERQKPLMAKRLSEILERLAVIQGVDTLGIQLEHQAGSPENIMRPDTAVPTMAQAPPSKNTPAAKPRSITLTGLTALQIGAKIQAGIFSAVDVAAAVWDGIAEQDRDINAFISHPARKTFLAEAAEIQEQINRGELTSPLAGVPIGIKDNICTTGVATTCASQAMAGFVPPYDATVAERLKKAGMLAAGKLNMDELAMGSTSETSYFGPVRNPWAVDRVPGGSSGGSAAAVAAGLVCCTLGSDTGGSIRQPASHCGVTGFKPSYGTVSRHGLIAYASSLDQIGPLAHDAADCAAIMDVLAGQDAKDSTTLELPSATYLAHLTGDIQGMRIALPEEGLGGGVNEDVVASIRQAAETFRTLGATVEYIRLPCLDYAIPAYYILSTAEASSNLARIDRCRNFGDEVVKRILLGTFVLSAEQHERYYQKARRVRAQISRQFEQVFQAYDAVLMPTSQGTAPLLGAGEDNSLHNYLADMFTVPANLAGLPALTVPAGFDRGGLPIGAQIVGGRLMDGTVLNLGHAFQSVTEYHKKRPVKEASVSER
ncbi:MAG: amidase family protein [Oscillospiraceae bacterium]|nr:amidase family protein [Oscillospiraceae bacterium]